MQTYFVYWLLNHGYQIYVTFFAYWLTNLHVVENLFGLSIIANKVLG